jgi:hypothetical protein
MLRCKKRFSWTSNIIVCLPLHSILTLKGKHYASPWQYHGSNKYTSKSNFVFLSSENTMGGQYNFFMLQKMGIPLK